MLWTDERLDRAIGNLLRAGVSISAVVVLAASIAYFANHARSGASYGTFHSEPQGLRTVSGIVSGALSWDAASWIQLGLLLLIATPIARVVFSVFAFAAQRDWIYVGITLLVLAILLYSLSGGGG